MSQFLFPLLSLSTSFIISISSHAEQAAHFSLKTSSFADRKDIPTLYTCDGKDISPQISWSGAPAKTQSFTLICHDPDAPAGIWYHWILYNIPSTASELPEGTALPQGASFGQNSWGKSQYNGPCPPARSIHRYIFTLYALDTKLPLPSGADADAVQKAMQGHILGKTTLMGVFGH